MRPVPSPMSKSTFTLRNAIGIGVLAGIVGGALLGLLTTGSGTPAAADADPTTPENTPASAPGDVAPISVASTPPADGLGVFRFDDLSLVNQNGESVDETLFDGRSTALAFFFTSCQGPCPALTAVMKRVQDETAGSNLRLLSVSVDGANDTPEVIRAYGDGVGADFERWTFATGAPEAVAGIAAASLQFSISRPEGQTVRGPRGEEVPNVIHPTRILLVGPDRSVTGVFAYNDPPQVERLIAAFSG